MVASAKCVRTLASSSLRAILWMAAVCAALLCLRSTAWAQSADQNAPAVRLISTIPINGTAGNPAAKMFSFGSSWVGGAITISGPQSLYFLADRSNASIDVVDITGRLTGTPESLFGQIGGAASGDTGSDATSGPNGVTIAAPCIFVTDGNSRVVSINANISFVGSVTSVSTGGRFRANGLAVGSTGGIFTLLVINDMDTPPFASAIPVFGSTCALGAPFRIPLKTALLNATNGAGQPVFWMGSFFYIPIPEGTAPEAVDRTEGSHGSP